jgi:predicted ATPase
VGYPHQPAARHRLALKGAQARPEQRAVAVAVLGALRTLAGGGPVVLAVDDVQWLDTASAKALEFALPRLRDERLGVLLAWRVEGPAPLPLGLERGLAGRLRRLRTSPLSLGAIHEVVLAALGVAFDRPILRRIHETSGGNPFFAGIQRVGRAPLCALEG